MTLHFSLLLLLPDLEYSYAQIFSPPITLLCAVPSHSTHRFGHDGITLGILVSRGVRIWNTLTPRSSPRLSHHFVPSHSTHRFATGASLWDSWHIARVVRPAVPDTASAMPAAHLLEFLRFHRRHWEASIPVVPMEFWDCLPLRLWTRREPMCTWVRPILA